MKKCIFLDRDGCINVEKHYLHLIKDFEFIKGAKEAIKIFNDLNYLVIVVTNQSGVARGYYSEESIVKLHEYIQKELKVSNGHIDDFYYCPHHPTMGISKYNINCDCRKPQSGMFLNAQKKYNIDFKKSIMIGDKISDIEAGKKLNMRSILVKTGHGATELQRINCAIEHYDSLYDVAQMLKLKKKD